MVLNPVNINYRNEYRSMKMSEHKEDIIDTKNLDVFAHGDGYFARATNPRKGTTINETAKNPDSGNTYKTILIGEGSAHAHVFEPAENVRLVDLGPLEEFPAVRQVGVEVLADVKLRHITPANGKWAGDHNTYAFYEGDYFVMNTQQEHGHSIGQHENENKYQGFIRPVVD